MRVFAAKAGNALFACAFAFATSACADTGAAQGQNRPRLAAEEVAGSPRLQAQNEARITVRGARISMGDAVDCPKIRSDDGAETPVSYLAPGIAIGERVEVTGFMAVTAKCRGRVLFVEEVRTINN